MKILMMIDRYAPIWGGSENQLRQLVVRLKAKGCNIKIVTRRWDSDLSAEEMIDDTPVYRVGWPGTHLLSTLSYLAGLVFFVFRHRRSIDIIHSHGAAALGATGRVLSWLIKKQNVAKIASAGKIPELQRKIFGKLVLTFFKKSNIIICLSQEIHKELTAIGVKDEQIARIINGVDSQRFSRPTAEEKRLLRSKKNLPLDAPIVLFSGRLVPIKGIDTLIEAWPKVSLAFPNALLLILGSGINQFNSIEPLLKEKIKDQNVTNIKFEGDVQQPEEYYALSDLLIFPSRQEGCPNVLLESMASGLPSVSSDIGGVTNLINEERGLLFPVGNAERLSSQTIKMLEDSTLRATMAQKAREYVSQNLTFEQVAEKYYSVYQKLYKNK